MKRLMRGLLVGGVLLAVSMLTLGCIFDVTLDVFVSNTRPGEQTLFISTTAFTSICDTGGNGEYSCSYFPSGASEDRVSIFTLTDVELALFLFVIDPIVVQLPEEANDFAGSYSHVDIVEGGALEITAGLDSVKIDANRTLTAEPGTQLVVLELPKGAMPTGRISFNFHFDVPDTMTVVEMKTLFTGRVDTANDTFYVPLMPCVADMASVPAVTVPLPAGGLVSLPVTSAEGCDNALYALSPSSPSEGIYLPIILK